MSREVLEQGLAEARRGLEAGLHRGVQGYIGRHGQPVLEYALGEARAGTPLSVDSIVPWFSSGKPVVAMAVALLFERGRLGLDDPVHRYLPRFPRELGACTLRHVLTHTGGFPGALDPLEEPERETVLERVFTHGQEYAPGTRAAYHATTGWYILGEIVRLVDGRPVERFAAEEIFSPLGMASSHLGIPADRQGELAGLLAHVHLGAVPGEHFASQDFVDHMNSPRGLASVNPSGGIRGPARDLGRFYDWLLAGGTWEGRMIISRSTVELFTACHRWGMPDMTLGGAPLAWGLGFGKYGNADVHREYSRRVFNHSGMVSSVGLADPEHGLSCVVITTGLLDPLSNSRRLRELNGAAIRACDAGRRP